MKLLKISKPLIIDTERNIKKIISEIDVIWCYYILIKILKIQVNCYVYLLRMSED